MAGQDASAVRVAGDAHIYLAPIGTAFPADLATDPIAPWVDLGFVTTDGITLSYGREITEIYAMQALDPVRVIPTKAPKSIAFALMQSGREQFLLALGGGTFVDETGAVRYTPPSASFVDERAMILDMIDGTVTYRYEYPRVQNREQVDNKMVREDASTFPVTMQILAPAAGGAPFEMVTDDPALDDGLLLAAAGAE